ncbi:hypothetical protein DM02DRAFT_608887 [Periconia macrospinosa]|uniref:Uncharacterized protein n=1 Tax=Periconia macrospinosa TaxID=97972 RepID=A0A2V1EBD3_9PLEO|nr:hypothetical protein DM02DRAFT_608887 [Periconia macrospinosa]
MGKPSNLDVPRGSGYRDDAEALSLHTTPDDYDYDDVPDTQGLLPPSYNESQGESSGASASDSVAVNRHTLPQTGRKDHNRDVTIKNGHPEVCENVIVMDPQYDHDPVYLEKGIRDFAQMAPSPLIYIMGTHQETTRHLNSDKREKKTVTDFRIVIPIQQYLRRNMERGDTSQMKLTTVQNGEKTYRGTVFKTRAPGVKQDIEVGTPPPTLTEWCHRFCASSKMLRIFRLERPVTGLDTGYLRNRIEGLIRATNYRGYISVTFPVEEKNIDIYNSSRINELRVTTWVRWVFFLTFLWIFSWPALYFGTKRYSVVRAEWPFSTTDATGRKQYTTISEEQWFGKWEVAIRRLVLGQYEGEASPEVLAGVCARAEDPQMPGTLNTGMQGLDQAANLLTQGFRFARSVQTGESLGRSLQGGWGYDT